MVTANTRGTPDVFAYHNDKWYAFEFKSPTGKLRKEQQQLKGVYVVRSVKEFLGVLVGS